MSDAPTVTVLIPARNEEADIAKCLEHVLAQDHPHDRIEIVLVDGGSTDCTVEVAEKVLSAGDISWCIVDNPTGTTPSNLNAGLAVATGEYLCRVDARSLVPPNYVRVCTEVLASRRDIVVVGGAQVARARAERPLDEGIARGLNNRFAMGGARYRSGAASGPSDTVYLGAFRTDDLLGVGGWDEAMLSNQDYDLNRRLGDRGLVWFVSGLPVAYLPRRSLGALARQYHRFGRWKVRYWRHTADRPVGRQVVLMVAPVLAAGTAMAFIAIRPRASTIGGLTLAGLAGLLLVDDRGSAASDAAPTRLIGATTIALVGTSWLSGIGREALRPGAAR